MNTEKVAYAFSY